MFENIARMIKVYFVTVLDIFFGGWKNVKKKRTNKTQTIQAKNKVVSMEEHSQDIRRTENC